MSKRNRIGEGSLVAVMMAAMILGGAPSAGAQDITGLQNGYLTFTNENPALYYRVEFRPNLTGAEEWDGAFRGLRNIHSSDADVTVPVGVFYRVVGRETPWVAGSALASVILSGKTAYVDDEEVTGTMPNIGQQTVTPGTVAQTITEGYHDGTGSVAGDADLVAGNIKKDVTIFGVTGTHEGGGGGSTYNAAVPKTGQTTSYRTGDDGAHQKGVVWPNPRFTDHGDGTVTDNLTGLMWVKVPHSLSGNSSIQTWNNAIDFCNGMSHAGHSDWRLPNVRELQSLIDYSRFHVALPSGHPFSGVQSAHYWSSSAGAGTTDYAWYVSLYYGSVAVGHKAGGYRVWPVRAEQ